MGNMLKSMKGASKQLEADLTLLGHPNQFPSVPIATSKDWDLLQTLDYRTLLCVQVYEGNSGAWNTAVAAVYEDIEDVPELLSSLKHTKRTVYPTRDATVLLMPTQALLRKLSPDSTTTTELIEDVRIAANNYIRLYIREDVTLDEGDLDLDTALGIYEAFHILEAQPERWSKHHLFKCNCPQCFKTAACVHSILAGMLCDSSIQVPSKYLGITVQQRRKRGRPTSKASELGDVGEARARERLALQKEYSHPKVSVCALPVFVCILTLRVEGEI
jgi:hypothetical protein